MDTDGRFTTPATRRTVVTTGAKLAYAAPLVATSLTLSAVNAAAGISLQVCPAEEIGTFCESDADCTCGFCLLDPGLPGECNCFPTDEPCTRDKECCLGVCRTDGSCA